MHVSPLYKAVWTWKEKHLSYVSPNVKEKTGNKQLNVKNKLSVAEFTGDKTIKFLENVDQNQQKIFKQKYQRMIRQGVPPVITLQDIKDVVTYLMIGDFPTMVLRLMHSYQINYLIRALILYMQLYLQIHDDLRYRNTSYAGQRLKHPISRVRETLCKTHLCKLRTQIGQEYSLLLAGEGNYKRYHHMNNILNKSYMTKEVQLNEYLSKLFARTVWVALYRTNYKEIETEIARLFHFKSSNSNERVKLYQSTQFKSDMQVLHGDPMQFKSCLCRLSPVISDIFIIDGDINQLCFQNKCLTRFIEKEISGLEAALMLPEELLARFGFTVGILGLPRDNFETMLHVKQQPSTSLMEELAATFITPPVEKPMVKMFEYISQLERRVHLNEIALKEGKKNLKEEIYCYFSNHINDSLKSFKLWNSKKYLRFNSKN